MCSGEKDCKNVSAALHACEANFKAQVDSFRDAFVELSSKMDAMRSEADAARESLQQDCVLKVAVHLSWQCYDLDGSG